jgi:hypothetical protein
MNSSPARNHNKTKTPTAPKRQSRVMSPKSPGLRKTLFRNTRAPLPAVPGTFNKSLMKTRKNAPKKAAINRMASGYEYGTAVAEEMRKKGPKPMETIQNNNNIYATPKNKTKKRSLFKRLTSRRSGRY